MKIESITFYCDICKKEIKSGNENLNTIPDKLDFKFGNGTALNFEHICSTCSEKIYEFLSELSKKELIFKS